MFLFNKKSDSIRYNLLWMNCAHVLSHEQAIHQGTTELTRTLLHLDLILRITPHSCNELQLPSALSGVCP